MPDRSRRTIFAIAFVAILAGRVWGISNHFSLLGDQMRDWSIALGSFADLPLVGPPTHVGGYTIGPAFYWILWAIRVAVGPFFQNLPHAGGIGQAILQSAADTLLLAAIWRRTESPWIALTSVVLIATASLDFSLSALVWNPPMGSTLAKAATALVLLGWHRGSISRATVEPFAGSRRTALLVALAWTAVHAYTGAIFVTVGVFTALVVEPLIQRDWRAAGRVTAVVVFVVALLQLPYVAHQVSHRFGDSAMGAVFGSVRQVVSGAARLEIAKSLAGYVGAVHFIQVSPWRLPFMGWLLLICGGVVALQHRRDPSLLAITVLPQVLALIGYALFLDDLDHYYYLSLMPAVVLTVLLAATAAVPARMATAVGVALLVAALALVPGRVRFAATINRMPQYGLLVDASQRIRNLRQPMRAIRTDFVLPPTNDPEYLYKILGGRIDRSSPWISVIKSDGQVVYQKVGP